MPIFAGTISGSIKSIAINLPAKITYFSVWDRSGSGATVNLGFNISGRDVYFKNIVLTAGMSSDETAAINMIAGSQILIVTSNTIDYYFSYNAEDD